MVLFLNFLVVFIIMAIFYWKILKEIMKIKRRVGGYAIKTSLTYVNLKPGLRGSKTVVVVLRARARARLLIGNATVLSRLCINFCVAIISAESGSDVVNVAMRSNQSSARRRIIHFLFVFLAIALSSESTQAASLAVPYFLSVMQLWSYV